MERGVDDYAVMDETWIGRIYSQQHKTIGYRLRVRERKRGGQFPIRPLRQI
jgi:hypothetical protein